MTDASAIAAVKKEWDKAVSEYNALPSGQKNRYNFVEKFYATLAEVENMLQNAPSGDPTTANLPAMPTS